MHTSLVTFADAGVHKEIFSVTPGLEGETLVVLADGADGVTLCGVSVATVVRP